MEIKDLILRAIKEEGRVTSKLIANNVGVSRQYAHAVLSEMVESGVLVKHGITRGVYYTLLKTSSNENILFERIYSDVTNEDSIWQKIKPKLDFLPENVYKIISYAFSEMMNNAIDHAESDMISVTFKKKSDSIVFEIVDDGIGVFKNIMTKFNLKREEYALERLLMGKTTTQPERHSGQGIFFTSKMGDLFELESYGYKVRFDNIINDFFPIAEDYNLKGTKVMFQIKINSKLKITEVFQKFQTDNETLAFDKTKVHIRLYTLNDEFVSRSQARRLTQGLDKFKHVILDFSRVDTIGQGFADEVFRVFNNAHPQITLEPINMNDEVSFMVHRVDKE